MLRRIEVMEAELDAGGNAGSNAGNEGMQDFRYALRKFCKDCENFATIAKISQSLRNVRYSQFFAITTKVIVHSKNLNFRYALYFRYDR